MAIQLPVTNTKLREQIDIDHLEHICRPDNFNRLPGLRDAKNRAHNLFELDEAITRSTFYVLLADGSLGLVEFERDGKTKHLWDFGKPF